MNIMLKRKSLFGFKYIRFKFSSQKLQSNKDVLHVRTSKLAELLDCTNYTAREIIARNGHLLSSDSSDFVLNAKFCGEFLKLSDVVEFPGLLTLNPSLLQHRFFSLQELGCSNISGTSILRYQQLVKKSPRELEREEGLRFCPERHLEACRRFLPDGDPKEDFSERLQLMHRDGGSSLWRLKEAANAQAFASRLQCSVAVTHHMFRVYPPLRIQSTGNTLKLLDVLLERFRFPTSKVCHSPSVLSLHHEAVGEFLEQLPSVLDVDTAELARRLPLLLRRPPQRLKQVESVLRSGGVQGAQLLCCPGAAALCPGTLRARLEALEGRPELRPFRPHRRFLWLAYHFGRLEPRLRALRDANAPIASIAAFTASDADFSRSLLRGVRSRCSTEALAYLAEATGAAGGAAEVAARLPPAARPCLPNCSRVVEFLRAEGVSRAQLAQGLDAALYEEEAVRRAWQELRRRPDWPEWAAHYNLLQLLVYELEARSGFRGRPTTLSEYWSSKQLNQTAANRMADVEENGVPLEATQPNRRSCELNVEENDGWSEHFLCNNKN